MYNIDYEPSPTESTTSCRSLEPPRGGVSAGATLYTDYLDCNASRDK